MKPSIPIAVSALEIVEQAQSANVTLALENVQDWLDKVFFNTPVNMSYFLQDMNHPTFGCTLDIMHAQLPGVLDDFIDSLSEDIVNRYASDLISPTKLCSPLSLFIYTFPLVLH